MRNQRQKQHEILTAKNIQVYSRNLESKENY